MKIEPYSWVDLVCQLVWWWRQRARMNQARLEVSATMGSSKVREAAESFMEALNPSLGKSSDQFVRDMTSVMEHWEEEAEALKNIKLSDLRERNPEKK